MTERLDRPNVRCAIYTRQSVARGDDFTSCDAQREACEAFVGSMYYEGWECIEERFDDLGISGGSVERPALRRLFDAILAGRLDAVVVHRFDRLTRSVRDWVRLQELFEDSGVELIVVTGGHGIGSSPLRGLMNNVLAAFGELEREIIGERLRESRAARRARGMRSAGRVPFGYQANVTTRQLEPHPEEAEIVREFFHRAANGESGAAIARWANERGIRTKSNRKREGGRWSGRTVLQILRSPLYVGQRLAGPILVPGVHPALVDDETARTAGDAIAARRTRSPRLRGPILSIDRDPFMLRGVLLCGGCGGPMTTSASKPVTIETRDQVPRYYRCRGSAERPACRPHIQIAARVVENAVLTTLRCTAGPDGAHPSAQRVLIGLRPYWAKLAPGETNEWVRLLVWAATWHHAQCRLDVDLDDFGVARFAELSGQAGE